MTHILFLLVPISVLVIYCHSNAANKKPKALVASHGEYLFVLTDLWTSWMVALIWVGWARLQSAGRELRGVEQTPLVALNSALSPLILQCYSC